MQPGTPAVTIPDDYSDNLMSLEDACKRFKFCRKNFWIFRTKHSIKTLSNGKVHRDDIVKGLEDERRGT